MGEAKRRRAQSSKEQDPRISYFATPSLRVAEMYKRNMVGRNDVEGRLLEWQANGHRYLLPPGGELVDNESRLSVEDLEDYLRLPFESTILEFPGDWEEPAACVVYAFDGMTPDKRDDLMEFMLPHDVSVLDYNRLVNFSEQELEGWMCILYISIPTSHPQLSFPTIQFFRRDLVEEVVLDGERYLQASKSITGVLVPRDEKDFAIQQLQDVRGGGLQRYMEHFSFERDKIAVAHGIHTVVDFCVAVHCANVRTRREVSSDEVRNARIGVTDKLPFSEFNVLTVDGVAFQDILQRPGDPARPYSPRKHHWRKGHWRRLADRQVWVRECEVGQKALGTIHEVRVL